MSFLSHAKADNLATNIAEMWRQFSQDRLVWLKATKEVRDYVFASDTTSLPEGNLPWKNRTVIPKMTQIHDNLLAQYMQASFPNDDWLSFTSYIDSESEKDRLTEQYLKFKLDQSHYKTTGRKLRSDWITFGMACAGVEYVHEKQKSLINPAEEITSYKGAKVFRVSPFDYVIDPRAKDYDSSVFIRRRLVPKNEILKHNNDTALIKYETSALESLHARRVQIKENEDVLKDATLVVDGFSSMRDYYLSDYVEVLEFWGDIYDPNTGELLENYTIGVIDRDTILYKQPNPMWNGKRPYAISGWRERPDNLYAQSPLQQLAGMQYRINHLENVKADIFDLTVHPIVVVQGEPEEDFRWEPNFIYYAGLEGKVDILKPDSSALVADTEINIYMDRMEEMAGAPKQTAGFRTAGEKTAFEVNVLQQGANKMFLEKQSHWEDTMESRILECFYVLTAMNWDTIEVMRFSDEETGLEELMSINKEDVIRDGQIKPMGAKHFERKLRVVQELREVLLFTSQIPSTNQHVDGRRVLKVLERELGIERDKIFSDFKAVTDSIDAQVIAQQHSAEMQRMMGEPNATAGQAQAEPQA